LAVTPDGQWVLVVTGNGLSVSKIKVSTNTEVQVYNLGRPGDRIGFASALRPIAAAPDSRKAYISDLQHERMWTIDLVADTATPTSVPLRDFGRDIAVAPDGSRVLITHGDPRGAQSQLAGLASLSLPQLERTEEILGYFYGVTLNPDGSLIFATNPDDDSMIVADGKTLQTVATVAVGQRPTILVYAPKAK
jgi:YVTN family beta-propeller protein